MPSAALRPYIFCLAIAAATLWWPSSVRCDEQRDGSPRTKLDYCVVGAGPAGLQMAYYLKKAGRDYMVFEKSNMTGHFFSVYPRHRRLISINKRHTGRQNAEYNLRHDWNSLISDQPSLLFKHFSSDYFPHADVMVKYLDEYRRKLDLRVQFDTEVRNVRRLTKATPTGHNFELADQRGDGYLCKYLLLANGMSRPNEPYFEGRDLTVGYENVSTDEADFEAKTVLILGGGNSAFETANHVAAAANYVHLLASSPPRFAWSTHYVGDLRAVNNEILDHYQLKSLDGILEANLNILRLVRTPSGRLALHLRNDSSSTYAPPEEEYDVVVRCLGFTYDDRMFAPCTKPERDADRKRKFPLIKRDYESASVPDMYFVGSTAHSLDFREAAGGFIHGFRYTARALHRLLEWKNHGVPWPSRRLPLAQLLDTILGRVNEASGIYQMHHILADVVIVDRRTLQFEYLEEFPLALLSALEKKTGRAADGREVLTVAMRYNPSFSGPRLDTFHSWRATDDVNNAHNSNFLHPVIYYYAQHKEGGEDGGMEEVENKYGNPGPPVPDRVHHMLEDFLTQWTSPHLHVEPLRKFLESCLGVDLRRYRNTECFAKLLDGATDTSSPLPLSCIQRPDLRATHFVHHDHRVGHSGTGR
ncbi:FAD-dependent oxidoreductase domain-containing protein 2-like [Haemaphysalis longicornis]